MSQNHASIEASFLLARDRYAEFGVDVENAFRQLSSLPISIHCWQGDDIRGFEEPSHGLGAGLAVTGNHPGQARTPHELRADLDAALLCIPGTHRLNLHAIYAETSGKHVERDELEPEHFLHWIEWARQKGMGLDFNPTFFAHPLAADGMTLSHQNQRIRQFWIRHGIACRRIGAAMGLALGSPCVTNVWIPDGTKDTPADRKSPRARLADSLDAIFEQQIDPSLNLDAVEGKLFGIGAESYTVGSHEFYFGYALTRQKLLCLDTGHFHPTESVPDKVSAVLQNLDRILLHVSRGVRWDSDHVVTFDDDLRSLALELVRGNYLNRVHIGLDYFDASINRVAAWVSGSRALLKALLFALVEPTPLLLNAELQGDFTSRLALLDEFKSLPFGPLWDHYCLRSHVPVGPSWITQIKLYESQCLSQRTPS